MLRWNKDDLRMRPVQPDVAAPCLIGSIISTKQSTGFQQIRADRLLAVTIA
jgi:hypothetical protein